MLGRKRVIVADTHLSLKTERDGGMEGVQAPRTARKQRKMVYCDSPMGC